jgi:hypothetical protein
MSSLSVSGGVLDSSFDAARIAHRELALDELWEMIDMRALLFASFVGQGFVSCFR